MKKNDLFISGKKNERTFILVFIFLEVVIFSALLASFIIPISTNVFAILGEPNATVTTLLTVGNVVPDILAVNINNGTDIDLVANSSYNLTINVTIRDFNGEGRVRNLTVEFFQQGVGSFGSIESVGFDVFDAGLFMYLGAPPGLSAACHSERSEESHRPC